MPTYRRSAPSETPCTPTLRIRLRGGRHSERQLLGLHRVHNVLRGHQLRCTVRIRPAEFLSLALLHAEHHRRGGRGDLVLDDVLDIPVVIHMLLAGQTAS